MIKISQKDFEDQIRRIINGEITRTELAKELETDKRTLNNKIQELYDKNPDLYLEFISKFPYRPNTYTHINYEAMMIDILKKGYTQRQAVDEYGISRPTMRNHFKEIEETNPELYELYLEVMTYRKNRIVLPVGLARKVQELEDQEIFIGGIFDEREKALLEKMKKLQRLKAEGKTAKETHRSSQTQKITKGLQRIQNESSAGNNNPKKNKKQQTDPDDPGDR